MIMLTASGLLDVMAKSRRKKLAKEIQNLESKYTDFVVISGLSHRQNYKLYDDGEEMIIIALPNKLLRDSTDINGKEIRLKVTSIPQLDWRQVIKAYDPQYFGKVDKLKAEKEAQSCVLEEQEKQLKELESIKAEKRTLELKLYQLIEENEKLKQETETERVKKYANMANRYKHDAEYYQSQNRDLRKQLDLQLQDFNSLAMKAQVATQKLGRKPKYGNETITKVKSLLAQGFSIRSIAKKLNMATATVQKLKKL